MFFLCISLAIVSGVSLGEGLGISVIQSDMPDQIEQNAIGTTMAIWHNETNHKVIELKLAKSMENSWEKGYGKGWVAQFVPNTTRTIPEKVFVRHTAILMAINEYHLLLGQKQAYETQANFTEIIEQARNSSGELYFPEGFNKTDIEQILNVTKHVLKMSYHNCYEGSDRAHLEGCYRLISIHIHDQLLNLTPFEKKPFSVTVGKNNLAYTYVEAKSQQSIDFSFGQIFFEILIYDY